MKILFFVESFCPHTETFVYQYVKHISKDVDSLVCCLKRENEDKFPYHPVTTFPKYWNLFQNKFNRKFIYFSYKSRILKNSLNEIIIKYNPTHIYCFFGVQALHIIDNLDLDIPVLIHFLGYDASLVLNKSIFYKRRLKTITKRNVNALYVSKFLNSLLSNQGIVFRQEITIPIGIDIKFFSRTNNSSIKEKALFVQVSSFSEKKGHEYTLAAFSKYQKLYPNEDFELSFVGDGYLRSEIELLIKSYNLVDKVVTYGWRDKNFVKNILNKSDVFVHHSITSKKGDVEGIPTAIIEAMSMELPILSTKHAGIPEYLDDGINGILIDEADVNSYVKALREIRKWPKLTINRQKALKFHDIEKQSEQIIEFMESF